MWGTYLCRGSGFLHSVYLEKNERSCTANTLWVSFQCMECTTCACATHLQNTVFGEVCAVDGVFHFVFAVQGAQRGWTKVPCNFLSDGNIWIITCSLALHFNIKLSEFGAVTPSLSWCQSLWTVVKVNILYRQSDYSAAEHVILWRKWQNTQQIFHWLRGGGLGSQAHFHHSFSKMTSPFAHLLQRPTGKAN